MVDEPNKNEHMDSINEEKYKSLSKEEKIDIQKKLFFHMIVKKIQLKNIAIRYLLKINPKIKF